MTKRNKTPDQLRSARWFAPDDLRAFGHRSRAMQMGYAPEEWRDRPVIAIINVEMILPQNSKGSFGGRGSK